MPTSIQLPKSIVTVLLASVFTLGFVITPYWRRAETTSQLIFILALTLLVGVIWLVVSARDLQIAIHSERWYYFVILLVVAIAINARALTSVIPWRGDEDYHIQNTLSLVSQVSPKWLLLCIVLFISLLYTAWRKPKWTAVTGTIALLGVMLFMLINDPLTGTSNRELFRYPFINYWFFAALPKLASFFRIDPHHEVLFRVLPFLSSFLIVWACQVYFLSPQKIADLLWGCAVATMPLLFYYSSILYLEPAAIFLMVLVSINIVPLLKEEPERLRQNRFWYALILVGFIKETTALFLLFFVFWRLVAFLARRWTALREMKSLMNGFVQEIYIALATLLPAILFFFLRNWQTKNRGFSADMANLTDPDVLQAIVRSFPVQLGLFLPLFIVGCLLLLRKKEYLALGFYLSIFLVSPFFFALDTARYAGYNRFNLSILPPVLAASGLAVRELLNRGRLVGLGLAGLIVIANIWASPLNWDGTKQPYWGNTLVDTSEHYYPYDEAIRWLQEHHGDDRILFTGMHYPYVSFSFYFSQVDWEPDSKIQLTDNQTAQTEPVATALVEAATRNFDVVLYQIEGNEIPQLDSSLPFVQEKVIQNDAHILVVYSRRK